MNKSKGWGRLVTGIERPLRCPTAAGGKIAVLAGKLLLFTGGFYG